MKIFDWVHRRLNTNLDYYCRVPQKKDVYPAAAAGDGEGEKSKAEKETEALLLDLGHVTSIHHVLDGILTIGTLGLLDHQPDQECLPDTPQIQQELFNYSAYASKEEEEEGVEKIIASVERRGHSSPVESSKKEILKEEITKNAVNVVGDEDEDLFEPLLKEMKDDKRERITLADLFLASDDYHTDPARRTTSASIKIVLEKEVGSATKTTVTAATSPVCRTKHGRAFTKKLTPWKKEGNDSPPNSTTTATGPKKLNRFIRRMLKRKIHPEMACEVHGSVAAMQVCGGEHLKDKKTAV